MSIEAELRAHLSEEQYGRVLVKLDGKSAYSNEIRWFIDLSKPLKNIRKRNTEVKVRCTNRVFEISIKKGGFGSLFREEAALEFSSGSLESALAILNLLGYSKGIYAARFIERVEFQEYEFSIHAILNMEDLTKVEDRFLEVEYIGEMTDSERIVQKLSEQVSELNLSPMDPDSWTQYVNRVNRLWNKKFDFASTDIAALQKNIEQLMMRKI